jgi:hypothetical protein
VRAHAGLNFPACQTKKGKLACLYSGVSAFGAEHVEETPFEGALTLETEKLSERGQGGSRQIEKGNLGQLGVQLAPPPPNGCLNGASM